jgi:hypothetical protein
MGATQRSDAGSRAPQRRPVPSADPTGCACPRGRVRDGGNWSEGRTTGESPQRGESRRSSAQTAAGREFHGIVELSPVCAAAEHVPIGEGSFDAG